MKKHIFFFIFLLGLSSTLSICHTLKAQNAKETGFLRDTSFTLHQTYIKEKKNFPIIQPVPMEIPENVTVKENVIYKTIKNTPYGERELHLNIYRPDDSIKYPALLLIHGGGWNSGDLTLQIPLAQNIAAHGYVTIPVEYRLIPEAVYPAGVEDLSDAIQWVYDNADKYNIDANNIAVSGCSAGGQLACLLGTKNTTGLIKAVINIDGISTFIEDETVNRAEKAREEGKKLPVDALWLGGTYSERAETWKDASALYWVNEKSAPVCFINSSIPRFHNGREELRAKLDNLGIYSEVHSFENSPHTFWFFYPWHLTTVNYAVNFLDKIFKTLPDLKDRKQYDIIVSQDGKGDFTTIQEAINSIPDSRKKETRIFIRNGIYREKIDISDKKPSITFIGEDVSRTIITYDNYASKPGPSGENIGTFGSGSIYINSDNFTAKNITFQNSAGPVGQAVAVVVRGDRAVFVNCRFLGFQDTLYTHKIGSRQYYKNCFITGTVDFIFGSSTAFFENCEIVCKKSGYITAASTPEDKEYGYIFYKCKIRGDNPKSFYLGRPWRPYAKVGFIECHLSNVIKPEGWHNWGDTSKEETATYFEYKNIGAGSDTSKRVKWPKQLTAAEAKKYTKEKVLGGKDGWNPKF